MSPESLFDLAETFLTMRRNSGQYFNNLLYGKYWMDFPRPDIERALVLVEKGKVKEIMVMFTDGSEETLRRENIECRHG